MPMLASKIVSPLVQDGSVCLTLSIISLGCACPIGRYRADTPQDAVEGVIEYMDEYYLGKEDWDAFVELGVDTMKDDLILKKIPTAVKSAFTRQYVPVHPVHRSTWMTDTSPGTTKPTILSRSTRATCLRLQSGKLRMRVPSQTMKKSLRSVRSSILGKHPLLSPRQKRKSELTDLVGGRTCSGRARIRQGRR